MVGCSYMRDILFRGKGLYYDEWVQGDLVQGVKEQEGQMFIWEKSDDAIFGVYECEVIPETVSQYIEMTDKNGNQIFEGDIVKLYLIDGVVTGIIKWCNTNFRFKFYEDNGDAYGFDDECIFEVVGNIYDKVLEATNNV